MADKPAPRTPIREPEMEAAYFGITVAHIGEDGDMVALGHHSPRRALAAFNRHARVFVGMQNVADDRCDRAEDWLDGITYKRAVFRTPDPADAEDPSWSWVADWSDPDHPDARPITLLGL